MAVTEVRVVEVGKVEKVLVKEGDQVKQGDVLLTSEVDKETQEIKAPIDGVVKKLNINEGDLMKLGQVLVELDDAVSTSSICEVRVIEVGKVEKVLVKKGDAVKEGDILLTSEVDKETQEIKAPATGIVQEVNVQEGNLMKLGQVLVIIEEGLEAPAKIQEVRVIEVGQVAKVFVKENEFVKKGDVLLTSEVDKETQEIKAPCDGKVVEVNVKEGDLMKLGQVLVSISEQAITKEVTDENHKELIIIGGGPGGYVAALYAAKCGIKVTLIEKQYLGGTCLNVGCIPTKTLIRSAELNEWLHHAKEFGIVLNEEPQVDMNRIIDRKNEVVNKLVSGVASLMKKNQVEVIEDTASFIDDHTIQVGEKQFSFENLIVATGSKISKINFPGIDLPCVLNSTSALELRELPKKITIIGGGVIGLEFAFLYRSLGVEVTVVEFLDRLIAMVDKEISEDIKKFGEEKGIHFELSSRVTEIKEENGFALTVFEKDGSTHEVESDVVLVAIGREPRMDELQVENTSLELNERNRGIHVNEFMQTNVDGIYAIGDVNNLIQLAHAASHQGIIAVDHILGKQGHSFDKKTVPSVIFTSPEIATIGVGEDELKEKQIPYKVGRFDYYGNGKAVSMGEIKGYVKLMKDENDVIIGGAIVGVDASSLIEVINMAILNHLKDEDIRKMIFAHPTTGETIHEAAMDLGVGKLHL